VDEEGELHPVVHVLAILLAVAAGIWATWCTVIAFIGGTMPLIGVETEGGLGFGLVFLIFLEPIAITIAYWFSILLLMPLQLLLGATDRR